MFQPYSLHQRFHSALLLSQLGPNPTADPIPCTNWLQQTNLHAPPNLTGDINQDTIALLPLWLFTHESWRQRLAWLNQIPTWNTAESNHQASLWLYGEAIAQVIRPKAQLSRLLTTLPDRWQRQIRQGAPPLGPIWETLLPQLQQWQQQHTPLNEVARAAHDRAAAPIAASLFSLVTSGPNWSVAQTRSHKLLPNSTTPSSLLGGLWGAAYGWTNLPIAQLPTPDRANPQLPWQTLSQNLLQTWSGQMPQPERPTPIVFGPR